MGIDVPLSHSDSDSDSDSHTDQDDENGALLNSEVLHQVLEAGKYNWFVVVQYVEKELSLCVTDCLSTMKYLSKMYSEIISTINDPGKKSLLEQSYSASLAAFEL